jgi:hypothetical protein
LHLCCHMHQERSEFTCRLVARMARIHLATRRDWYRWDWRQRDGPCMTRIRLANGHDSQRIHISAGLSYTCRTKANRHGPRWKLSWFVCLLVCGLPAVSCALRCPSRTRPSQHILYGYSLGVRPGYSASASAACRGQHGPAWLDILDAARPPLRPPRQAAAARQLRRARCGNVSHRHATRGAAWQPKPPAAPAPQCLA